MRRFYNHLTNLRWEQIAQGVIAAILVVAALGWFTPQPSSSMLGQFYPPTITPTVTSFVLERLPNPTTYIPTATPPPLIHVVQQGEVLSQIAELYDTTEDELVRANGMKSADDIIVIGQELVIAGANRTPVPLAFDTSTPTPTATSVYRFPAPILLSPADYETFATEAAPVALQWSSVAILAEGEWYEVQVWQAPDNPANGARYRTRSTSWTLPLTLRASGPNSLFLWQVSVIYAGRTVEHLSPPTEVRHFRWE